MLLQFLEHTHGQCLLVLHPLLLKFGAVVVVVVQFGQDSILQEILSLQMKFVLLPVEAVEVVSAHELIL
jgi:hypothetical protein